MLSQAWYWPITLQEYTQYKAMLISLAVHLLLLMFELLTADNLDTRRHKVTNQRPPFWQLTNHVSVDPGVHPPGGGQHPEYRHLCVECEAWPDIRAGAVLCCQHPPVCISRSQTRQVSDQEPDFDLKLTPDSQHHHLVVGDHLHPPVDRALHLPGRRPLHHHLRWDPPQNARRKSGIYRCYETLIFKSDFSMLSGSPTVLD